MKPKVPRRLVAASKLPDFSPAQLRQLDAWLHEQQVQLQRAFIKAGQIDRLEPGRGYREQEIYQRHAHAAVRWLRANLSRTLASREGRDASGRHGTS